MYELRIRTLAQQDVQEIIDYYDSINPSLTEQFLNILFNKIETIKTNPLLFSKKYKETRMSYLRKFPFNIYYQINNENIDILAITHTSRNPKIWQER